MIEERTPFLNSLDFVRVPNNSSEDTALGSKQSYSVSYPILLNTLAKVFHTALLPHPAGPIINTQCLTSRISLS